MENKYGGFFRRSLAYFIDGIISYIPFVFVFGYEEEYSPMVMGIYTILWTAYFVWMTGTYGATIGKMATKLKVIKDDGTKVSYADALVRELASYLSLAILGLGFLNVIWDGKKQAWHDKIAKTLVVKTA